MMKRNEIGEIIQHRIYIKFKEVTESMGAIFRVPLPGVTVN